VSYRNHVISLVHISLEFMLLDVLICVPILR
jgi:hypothetical protein